MEYMGGGCLTDILEAFDTIRLSERHIAYICRETLSALAYIHSLHRIHRDIKVCLSLCNHYHHHHSNNYNNTC